MVMEHAKGGDLQDVIYRTGQLEEDTARKQFQMLINGVSQLHNNSVVHRDFKPENLLLDEDDNLKIVDFGLSNYMSDGSLLRTSCGSPNYASPEIVKNIAYSGEACDVWSIGVILQAMLCGKLPFDEESNKEVFKKIKLCMYKFPRHLNDEVKDLIARMLHPEQQRRITIEEIKCHSWYLRNLPKQMQLDLSYKGGIEDESFKILKKLMNVPKEKESKIKYELKNNESNE